jgi:hypothetical protein
MDHSAHANSLEPGAREHVLNPGPSEFPRAGCGFPARHSPQYLNCRSSFRKLIMRGQVDIVHFVGLLRRGDVDGNLARPKPRRIS